jgi:hypothetical protein
VAVRVLATLNTTPVAILGVASLVIGYIGIWALWHFVFSPRNEHDDDLDRSRRPPPEE